MDAQSYRLLATNLGDLIKWDGSVKQIERTAGALFQFTRQDFPNSSITSERAKLVYDWILSLAKQTLPPAERDKLLLKFCRAITPDSQKAAVEKLIADVGLVREGDHVEFDSRRYHTEIFKHSRKLFIEGHHFHAVFEAAKVYNKLVKKKSLSAKDGQELMLDVWGPEKGVLKITACLTETDRNVQDGVKFLSAGLMRAIRNPTAHEPALDWPITKEDALDILSFISFLFRQLDSAQYFKA